jgi:protein-disulfide isomerase
MKNFYYVLGAIAVVGIVLIGLTLMRQGNATMAPVAQMAGATSEELVQKARGVVHGDENAPVQLMVFSDYMCPGCAVFATTIEPQIRSTYGNRVAEIYHDFPLTQIHQYSFLAARAARCAEDQNKFWELHDALFARQREWSFSATAPVKQFGEYAEELGLDRSAFDSCLRSDAHADLVTANMELGQRVGVPSTPTVYINGRMSAGPMNWEILKPEIDRALGIGASPAAQ